MTPTPYRPSHRDPVIVTGRRRPAFVDQHNWLAQSAFEVIKLCEPLTHSLATARAVEVICAKIDINKSAYMGERVMLSAAPEWMSRISEAIEYAQCEVNSKVWGYDSTNFEHTHLGLVVAQAVVGYFVPEDSDPDPEVYRALLCAPLCQAIDAAQICQAEPLVAEFVLELGPTLPVGAKELLDRARQLTKVTT